MNIQGFMKLTLLDFPGKVAATVFTGGCNLRCPFCHNADLVRRPCAEQSMEEEVLAYLRSRTSLLEGVAFTGGEPLLQPDLADFMKKVREMGYAVKLDTNGALPDRLADLLATGLVDYVAMDIKNAPDRYPVAVGTDTDISLFKKSVEILRSGKIPFEFRTTAVKGIHRREDFEEIGKWLCGAPRYYIQTFVDSGNLLSSGCEPFSPGEMNALLETVKKYIPGAELRGQG